MSARWQNQINNNVGIGAACAACRVKGHDDRVMAALNKTFRSKIKTAIGICNSLAGSRLKPTKADP
jgi:Ni,Fe-hydrogenase I small subunit